MDAKELSRNLISSHSTREVARVALKVNAAVSGEPSRLAIEALALILRETLRLGGKSDDEIEALMDAIKITTQRRNLER